MNEARPFPESDEPCRRGRPFLSANRLRESSRGVGWALLGLALSSASLACDDPSERTRPPARGPLAPQVVDVEPVPLTGKFLARGLRALEKRVPQTSRLIEIRAERRRITVQMVQDQGVVAVSYFEDAHETESKIATPQGELAGPDQVPVYGEGSLEENAFGWDEVDVMKVASAFDVAIKAVDPNDGWIESLVVRRYLPFGQSVRARIYVQSPRMKGSIDTNGLGIPLKR